MDVMLKENCDGTSQMWYSENYLINQINNARLAGISEGVRVEFHAITPSNEEEVDRLVKEFRKRVDEIYNKTR